jgi:hypothetical protein
VYGSFHGCVDFLLVALVIFVSIGDIFVGILCAPCSFDSEVFGFGFVGGSWIVASCIFVLDHDPSNSEFDPRLKDFGWNPSF